MIWYLYPTHAYRKPSALVFHLIKVWSTHTCRGRFLRTGLNCATVINLCITHIGLRKHNPVSEKYLTWWSLTWWWDPTWWSQNDKFKSKQGREQTSSGGKTLLRLGYHPVIYETGTDWNWDVMGKESMNIWSAGLNLDHCMQYSHRLPLLTSSLGKYFFLLLLRFLTLKCMKIPQKLTCFECTFNFIFLLLKF